MADFAAAGLWPNFPRSRAGELVGAGVRLPTDVTASRLTGLTGVAAARAERLAQAFHRASDVYDVAALLAGAGLALRPAGRLVAALGTGSAALLAADPWRVLEVLDADLDLTAADRLARHLDIVDPDRRGRAVVCWVLERRARAGHTAWPVDEVAAGCAELGVRDPAAALAGASSSEEVVLTAAGTVALARYAAAERAIAAGLARLQGAAARLASPAAVAAAADAAGLDSVQRRAVEAVARHGVSLLTGGPGTGKSRTVAALVQLARAGEHPVALAAPTGRAAKRLEELADAPCTTLHRLLGAQGARGGFARGELWPVEARLVVVDETSMLDVELAAALLSALADGTHLLLVGDPAQLPSIGAGRVLADIVDAGGYPVTELSTLYRQAEGGAIARLATEVRGGRLPPVSDATLEVVVSPAPDAARAAQRAVQLVTEAIPRALGIPPEEIQVLTPVHRGPAGTVALNTALKAVLNPGPGERRGFDPGDRVVATANHLDAGFANGEVGVVIGTAARRGLRVAFPTGEVEVPADALGDLRHGWAVTVHRAQGSEWPAVVTVLPPESGGLLTRALVYTAFTRARRHLTVVPAVGGALAGAVARGGGRPRVTQLATLLPAAARSRPGRG